MADSGNAIRISVRCNESSENLLLRSRASVELDSPEVISSQTYLEFLDLAQVSNFGSSRVAEDRNEAARLLIGVNERLAVKSGSDLPSRW
jgi:hypothetical protein